MTRETGIHNAAIALGTSGLKELSAVYYNLGAAELYEETLRRGEAELTAQGALVARTGQHTGRSPKDKFVVRDASTEDHVWWDNNSPMSPEAFELLYADFVEQAKGKELFVQDLIGGADEDYKLNTRVITEFAWHSLFIRNLLIRSADRSQASCRR
jgi:phosphoenolpyruvate carboxykinase (ATP)